MPYKTPLEATTHHLIERARALLEPDELEAFGALQELEILRPLDSIAELRFNRVNVKDFFLVPAGRVTALQLAEWAQPMLMEIDYFPGCVADIDSFGRQRSAGGPSYLLGFWPGLPDPLSSPGAREWIDHWASSRGVQGNKSLGRHDEWWRTPPSEPPTMFLQAWPEASPRLLLNDERDPLLAGPWFHSVRMVPGVPGSTVGSSVSPRDVAAVFHNSLTLLEAELRLRDPGRRRAELKVAAGRVLRVPLVPGAGEEFGVVDAAARRGGFSLGGAVGASNAVLVAAGVDAGALALLERARMRALSERASSRRSSGGGRRRAGNSGVELAPSIAPRSSVEPERSDVRAEAARLLSGALEGRDGSDVLTVNDVRSLLSDLT